jgi:hypothetical protein
MKNIFFLFVIISFSIVSCQKGEQVYSCDSEVNEYVNENLSDLKGITYEELVAYELDYQKGVFRTLTKEEKAQMWISKLEEVLELTWSETEISYIESMKEAINENWFDLDISDVDKLKRDEFLQQKIAEGNTEVGLSMGMLYSLFARIDIPVDPNAPSYMKPLPYGSGGSSSGNTGDCKCSQSSDWCLQSGYDCEDDDLGCNETAHGCGTFWTYKCNGICQASLL